MAAVAPTPDTARRRAPRRAAWQWMLDARWPVAVVFVVVLLTAWQTAEVLDRLPDYILGPWEIAGATVEHVTDGTILPALASSLGRLGWGFVIGAGTGVLLGLLAGTVRAVEDLIDPIVSLTYPLPKIALFPAIAVWLGFSDRARILVIALACFYPAFVNALSGTRAVDQRFVWVADNLGAGPLRTFASVVVPGALPRLLVGLRISLALAFVLLFATEAIASREGLGFLIMNSYISLRYDLMYAAIAVLGVAGFTADRLLVAIGRRLTRGQDIEAIGRA